MLSKHTEQQQQPRDTPSTTFQPDPHLQNIYTNEQFGVVLVAAWPPPRESFIKPYVNFVENVKQCFDPIDFEVQLKDTGKNNDDINSNCNISGKSSGNHTPNVYLYPPQHLHITIATFHPFNKAFDSGTMDMNRSQYKKACQQIVQNAMKRNDWNSNKIYVKVDRAQIGEKAGILLYCDDELGSIKSMREILREEYKAFMLKHKKYISREIIDHISNENKQKEIIIPNIIHSTFLRFADKPQTNGALIQERFQSLVQENIQDIFKDRICIDSVRLVVEKRAYMHIECDSEHVIESSFFS